MRRVICRSLWVGTERATNQDRKSTRLNSSHQIISYAVFCLKKKKINDELTTNFNVLPPFDINNTSVHRPEGDAIWILEHEKTVRKLCRPLDAEHPLT